MTAQEFVFRVVGLNPAGCVGASRSDLFGCCLLIRVLLSKTVITHHNSLGFSPQSVFNIIHTSSIYGRKINQQLQIEFNWHQNKLVRLMVGKGEVVVAAGDEIWRRLPWRLKRETQRTCFKTTTQVHPRGQPFSRNVEPRLKFATSTNRTSGYLAVTYHTHQI